MTALHAQASAARKGQSARGGRTQTGATRHSKRGEQVPPVGELGVGRIGATCPRRNGATPSFPPHWSPQSITLRAQPHDPPVLIKGLDAHDRHLQREIGLHGRTGATRQLNSGEEPEWCHPSVQCSPVSGRLLQGESCRAGAWGCGLIVASDRMGRRWKHRTPGETSSMAEG